MKAIQAARILAILVLGVALAFPAAAHGEEDFERAEQLIKDKVQCSELTDDELEIVGEYYMEQMHPGELHEIMDERMGGEGSESLRLAHISMAQSFYCGNSSAMPMGMMSMMMGRGGGMMGNTEAASQYNMMGYSTGYTGLNSLLLTLLLLLFIAVAAVILLRLMSKPRKRR